MESEQEAVLTSLGEELDAACRSLARNGEDKLQVFPAYYILFAVCFEWCWILSACFYTFTAHLASTDQFLSHNLVLPVHIVWRNIYSSLGRCCTRCKLWLKQSLVRLASLVGSCWTVCGKNRSLQAGVLVRVAVLFCPTVCSVVNGQNNNIDLYWRDLFLYCDFA